MREHEWSEKRQILRMRGWRIERCPVEKLAIGGRLAVPIFLDIVDADLEGLREGHLGAPRRDADAHGASRQLEQREATWSIQAIQQAAQIVHRAETRHVSKRIDRLSDGRRRVHLSSRFRPE